MARPRGLVHGTAIIVNVFLVSLVYGSEQRLDLSLQVSSKPPYYQGQIITYQSNVKHQSSLLKLKAAQNVTVIWLLPSFISYKNYHAIAKLPVDVTSTVNQITMKFGSLGPSESINILINVTVDPSAIFRDNRFHYATLSTTVNYRWSDPCTKQENSNKVVHLPFFCPECKSFGAVGIENGTIKDSQIQTSTFQIYPPTTKSWVPMTSFLHLNTKRRMKLNFYQVDLKFSRELLMVIVDGIAQDESIPLDVVKLSFSQNSWKWTMLADIYRTEVFSRNDDTVLLAIATVKPIKTRHLRINIPPFGLSETTAKVYKVELYACNVNTVQSEEGNNSPSPVGIETSSLVPDSRFSSPSSLGPQYQPRLGRLNTKAEGGSWCASSCNPLKYLQIDLGETWTINEIKQQGRYTTDGAVIAVKTYSLSSSLDGGSWTPYTVNGVTNIFWGNDIPHLATRHKLSKPITARYVRFEPRSCIQKACMRVELYGTKVSASNTADSPVVFGRSMLLNKAADTIFVCNSEITKDISHCYYSKDYGNVWQATTSQVLNVLAFDPVEQRLYGLSKSGKAYLKSKDSEGLKWEGISQQEWYSVRDRSSVYTAVEIPFVPLSRNVTNVIEPLIQMTTLNGSYWQADQVGVYFKPNGGSIKMVLSFLPYSYDLSTNPCHKGVCVFGRCELFASSQYNCTCKTGYTGSFCDTVIDYCVSNPCQNSATCTPLLNSIKCTCTANYFGTLCQEFDDCSSSPCLHGGTCIDGSSSYTCSCLAGYSGLSCEVTPCTVNPCLNGGTCKLVGSGYKCVCKAANAGSICQYDPFIIRRGSFAPSSQPWDYSSGKFDKIIFKVNRTMQLLGVCLPDTFSASSTSELTLKTKNLDGAGTSSNYRYSNNYASGYIGNSKLRCASSGFTLKANVRYLIEVLMKGPTDFRKVVNGVASGTLSLPDGSKTVLYTFQSVEGAAFTDSNGATHTTGGITGLQIQFK